MTDNGAESKAQTRAIFNRLANEYDVAGPGCFAWFGRRLAEEAGIQPGAHVLDVGTGRGAVLLPAAELAGPAGYVIGIDLSEEMVRFVSEELERRDLAGEARVMDAEQLDFPDASLDVVLCGFGVMFFPNLDRALGEFRRVLRPGGRFGVSTWQVSQAEDLAVVVASLGYGEARERGWIDDADTLGTILERAGFSDVRVIPDSHTFRYDSIDQYWQNARGTGLRRWLDALDAEQEERVRATLVARVSSSQQQDGLYLEASALLATGGRLPDNSV